MATDKIQNLESSPSEILGIIPLSVRIAELSLNYGKRYDSVRQLCIVSVPSWRMRVNRIKKLHKLSLHCGKEWWFLFWTKCFSCNSSSVWILVLCLQFISFIFINLFVCAYACSYTCKYIYSLIGIQDRSISSTEPKWLFGISFGIHCRMPQSTGLIFPRRGLGTYRGLSSTLYRSSGFQTFRSHDPLTYPIPDSRWAQFLRANPLMTIPWSIWPCSQDRGHLFSYRDFVLNFPDGFFSSLAPSLCAWSIWPAHVTVALYLPIGIRGFGVCYVNARTSLGFPIPRSPMSS